VKLSPRRRIRNAPSAPPQGRFLFGAVFAVSDRTSRADAEGIGLPTVGGKLLVPPLRFPSRHGLGVAWTRGENHSPEPLGLGPIAPLLGQNGELAQGEMAVDPLVDAAELVGTLQRQDPPPAGSDLLIWGPGGLRGVRVICLQKRGLRDSCLNWLDSVVGNGNGTLRDCRDHLALTRRKVPFPKHYCRSSPTVPRASAT
jgi:hypothetical protein